MKRTLHSLQKVPICGQPSLSQGPRQSLVCFLALCMFALSRNLHKWTHTVCTFTSLASLTQGNDFENHPYCCTSVVIFLFAVCSLVRMYLPQLVYPFTCWWAFRLFPLGAITNNAMNISVQVLVVTYIFSPCG